jgi:hypothetical protein
MHCLCVNVYLPTGNKPIAVNKYIKSNHIIYHIIYHIISYIISYIKSHHNMNHIIKYHTISYHTVSYHIIPYHIISNHITSYITSYHIKSHHITSYHTIWLHIIPNHITSYHIILYHISYRISYHIASYHTIPHHIKSNYIISYPIKNSLPSVYRNPTSFPQGHNHNNDIHPIVEGAFIPLLTKMHVVCYQPSRHTTVFNLAPSLNRWQLWNFSAPTSLIQWQSL